MTKEQVEEILAKSTPQDRERIQKMLQHSCSVYDFVGNHLPHPYEKENLLEIIGKRDTYVVDTNSEWKRACREQVHKAKAFIITPALSREQTYTKDLILDKARPRLHAQGSRPADRSVFARQLPSTCGRGRLLQARHRPVGNHLPRVSPPHRQRRRRLRLHHQLT